MNVLSEQPQVCENVFCVSLFALNSLIVKENLFLKIIYFNSRIIVFSMPAWKSKNVKAY